MANIIYAIPSWAIIILTIGLIGILFGSMFYCICCKREDVDGKQFYLLENNTISKAKFCRNSLSSFFRRFSTSDIKNTAVFTSENLPIYKNDLDFGDSMDISERFNGSVLKIDSPETGTSKDDMLSCISEDSKHSFYSTYPLGRQLSQTETFVSININP